MIVRQRMREAARAAEMYQRWAAMFSDEETEEPVPSLRAARKGWTRWIGWSKPQRAAS